MRGSKNICQLECPKCHEVWAELKYKYGSLVKAKDVTVLKGDKKYKNGDDLACTICTYPYTNWDIVLAIVGKKSEIESATEISPIGTYVPHRRKKGTK